MDTALEPHLSRLLAEHGWTIERRDGDRIFTMKRSGTSTTLAVAEVANTAWDFVRGAFADAALRAQAAPEPRSKRRPVAVVGGPKITDKLVSRLRDYRDRYAPDLGWGVVDRDGRLDLWGDVEIHVAPSRPPRGSAPKAVNIWSDLGRWVMKVLLMRTIAPDDARWMPDVRGVGNEEFVRILAGIERKAGVDRPSSRSLVWQIRNHLERERYLDETNTVLRPDELLERWRHRQERTTQHRLSWVLAGGDTRARLAPLIARGAGRACLGGFSACREHGVAVTPAGAVEVYLRSLELAAEVRLTSTPAGETPDVLARVPEAPESVFRGVAQARDGTMYADLIQCWLDLVDLSAQGRQQADVIRKRRFHLP